jgi:hypothetical protein
MKTGMRQLWSDSKADIILFLVLLVAALKYTAGVDRVVDVLFYDESLYLLAGVKLAARGLYCPECGPLYAPLYNAWYFLLSFLTRDNLSLYWLNYKLMTIIPALLSYVLLRKNNVSYLVSAAIAVVVLTSAANIPVWPKPSHFGIIVTLVFLIAASRAKSFSRALALGSLGAFITSYVRPEYFLTSVLLALILAGGIIARRAWRTRKEAADLSGLLVIALIVIAIVGLPVSGSRSLCAFGQHFAIYWVSWTGSELHPWVDWEVIFTQNFGQAHGMLDVVRNNPHMFFKHVSQNIVGLAGNFGMLFPTHLFGDKIAKLAIVAVVGWVFVVRRKTVQANFARYRGYILIVALFLLASVIAIVTVYPRPHYFVFPVILLTTLLAMLLSSRETAAGSPRMTYVLVLSGLILAVTPSPYLNQGDQAQENIRVIRFVQNMHISRPVNILEAEGGFDIYMGDNFRRIGEAEKSEGFREFMVKRDIGVIVVTELLATDLRFRNDPEWQNFLANYGEFGFERVQIPGSGTRVLVRKDLVH